MLALHEIVPNPRNPPPTFDEDAINQLAESLKSDGQIQPVVDRRVGRSWQLIAGEGRWRAARRAGISTIAAVVREA
jgi:ParB family chromosome partitioning protein